MTDDPEANAELHVAAIAVSLGADSNCGLDYLRLPDEERSIAREVLTRAVKMRTNELKYAGYQVAKFTWGGGSKTDE